MADLIQLFFERVSRNAGPALTDISGGVTRSIDGASICDQADRLAMSLAKAGVKPGDIVIAVFDNTLESALLLLSSMRHGITLCLQPAGTAPKDLESLQRATNASTIVNSTRTEIQGATQIRLEDLVAQTPLRPGTVSPRTPFTITFTSGSTGAPKGIVHCAESFLNCAIAFNRQSGITAGDRFLNVMPMYYMAGIFNGILAPLMSGAAIVIGDAFNTTTAMQFWRTIAAERITAVWLSPTMLSLVARLDRTDKKVPNGFRRLFVGTGAMTASSAENFYNTYGLPPLQSYGLSELLYISVDDAKTPNFGTVGYPLEGVELTGGTADPLGISSPFAFLGYFVDGALQPFAGEFLTSDLAEVSESGALSILGRADDMILRGGVNLNPVDLETLLEPLMGGRVFCISGQDDAMLGQKVVLVTEGAVPSDKIFAEAQSIIRNHPGRGQLDSFAMVAKLPLGPTGKTRRAALRAILNGEGA